MADYRRHGRVLRRKRSGLGLVLAHLVHQRGAAARPVRHVRLAVLALGDELQLLARIAALRLDLLATHPDRAAGLACLARPLSGFSVFAFAIGAVLCAAWGTKVLAGRTTPVALLPSLLGLVLVNIAVAASTPAHVLRPPLPGAPACARGLRRLASTYVRDFHSKWLAAPRPGEFPLGSSDIQSLNDLGGAFQVSLTTRLVPFGMRSLLAVCFGCLLPAVPLYLSELSAHQVMSGSQAPSWLASRSDSQAG